MPPCGIAAAWLPWGDRSGGIVPCVGTRTALQKAASSWGETGPRGWREIPKFDKAFDCK